MLRKTFPDSKSSIAVIIPKEVSNELHIEVGQYVDIVKEGNHFVGYPVYIEKTRNNLKNYEEKI